MYIRFLLQTLFQSVSNIPSFYMVIPLCVEYLTLAHCSLQEPFCQPDMLQQGSLIPFIISSPPPPKKKKTDDLKERQHHQSNEKRALLFARVSKVYPLRHHPSYLSLQVVTVRRKGSFAEVFADYACISEDLNT